MLRAVRGVVFETIHPLSGAYAGVNVFSAPKEDQRIQPVINLHFWGAEEGLLQ